MNDKKAVHKPKKWPIILVGSIATFSLTLIYTGVAFFIWVFYELLLMESVHDLSDYSTALSIALTVIGVIIVIGGIVVTTVLTIVAGKQSSGNEEYTVS